MTIKFEPSGNTWAKITLTSNRSTSSALPTKEGRGPIILKIPAPEKTTDIAYSVKELSMIDIIDAAISSFSPLRIKKHGHTVYVETENFGSLTRAKFMTQINKKLKVAGKEKMDAQLLVSLEDDSPSLEATIWNRLKKYLAENNPLLDEDTNFCYTSFEDLKKLVIVGDIKSEVKNGILETAIVYNEETDEREEMTPSYLQYTLKALESEPKFMDADFVFDPTSSIRIDNEDGRRKFNPYFAPKWSKDFDWKKHKPTRHKEFKAFLDVFNPGKQSQEAHVGWLYDAYMYKTSQYLVGNAPKGIGKGIHGDEFCKYFFGIHNWTKAASEFLTSQFNSMMANKRIMHIDEFSVSAKGIDAKLKNYINDEVPITAKGSNSYTIKNFCNFIISSNNLGDIRIHSDDRRFCVLDLNEENKALSAKNGWSTQRIDELVKSFKDVDTMRCIAAYILQRGEKSKYRMGHDNTYRGEHYWHLVYETLAVWKKRFIEGSINKIREDKENYPLEEIELKHFQKGNRKAPESIRAYSEFFKNHWDRFNNRPGKIIYVEGFYYVLPNINYLNEYLKHQNKINNLPINDGLLDVADNSSKNDNADIDALFK